LNKVQYPTGPDVLKVPWFHKMTTQVPESYVAKASQSQRWNSHAPLHLPHLGLCTSPSLNQCPFKLQCPVSSSVRPLSWFLLKLSNSPALLAEGILRKPLACLCPRMDCHCYAFFLLITPLITSLPTMVDMPRAGSGPVSGCEEPCLASWLDKQFEGLYCLQLPLKMKAVTVLWKCQDHSPSNMASYPRGNGSSALLLWEPPVWHDVISVAAYNTYHPSVHWCL
jgi:hypothetical protein